MAERVLGARAAYRGMVAAVAAALCAGPCLATVYGRTDKRQTEAEYAKTHGMRPAFVADKVKPTGLLTCGHEHATANVVVVGDVLGTVAHVLDPDGDGRNATDPRDCVFRTKEGNSHGRPIRVTALLATGYARPSPRDEDDWAVLRLESPVPGVVPYRIEERSLPSGWYQDLHVTVAAAFATDFLRDDGGLKERPKYIVDCTIKSSEMKATFFATDCDGGDGTSGGAILAYDFAEPTLVGIMSGDYESDRDRFAAARYGRTTKHPYDRSSWAAFGVRVNREFIAAVTKAARDGSRSASNAP